jgi:hypothetical protein
MYNELNDIFIICNISPNLYVIVNILYLFFNKYWIQWIHYDMHNLKRRTNLFIYIQNEWTQYIFHWNTHEPSCWGKVGLNNPLKGWIKRRWNEKLLSMGKMKGNELMTSLNLVISNVKGHKTKKKSFVDKIN